MSVGDVKSKERIKSADFIGICGFSGVGKDETVKILNTIGFKRVSLADPVRQGIYNINPLTYIENNFIFSWARGIELEKLLIEINFKHRVGDGIYCNLKNIVDYLSWDEAKKIPEVRRLLQYYGTEGGRDVFGQTIWTDTADKYIRENNIKKVAVSDVRFSNELNWVRSKPNNLIIKIKRKGVGPINSHASDLGIADELCDIIINNDGNLEDLRKELLNNETDKCYTK